MVDDQKTRQGKEKDEKNSDDYNRFQPGEGLICIATVKNASDNAHNSHHDPGPDELIGRIRALTVAERFKRLEVFRFNNLSAPQQHLAVDNLTGYWLD